MKVKEKIFRLIAFLFSFINLILQFILIQKGIKNFSEFVIQTIAFFSYMTIWSNVLVASVYFLPLMIPKTRAGKFFLQPFVQTAILVYIIIVCIVYSLLLAKTWNPQGLQKFADVSLHYIIPLLYVLFWILFVQKGSSKLQNVFAWLVFPLAYVIYALIVGSIKNSYPYPFLDLNKNTLAFVAMMIAIVCVGYIIIGIIAVAADKLLYKIKKGKSANPD
jgi:hypothetical protein